mmetsp:Transcript_88193/g.139401  ORF Transcript_88193/g.139401 Transcript_88193/m.139401 type:complete len:100 (+) Transcript_88193:100-399(+)
MQLNLQCQLPLPQVEAMPIAANLELPWQVRECRYQKEVRAIAPAKDRLTCSMASKRLPLLGCATPTATTSTTTSSSNFPQLRQSLCIIYEQGVERNTVG